MCDEVISTATKLLSGNCINDVEVESKVEYFFFQNGTVLSKYYQNGQLRMVSVSKTNTVSNKL